MEYDKYEFIKDVKKIFNIQEELDTETQYKFYDIWNEITMEVLETHRAGIYDSAYNDGYSDGYNDGFVDGESTGYNDGYEVGFSEGKED